MSARGPSRALCWRVSCLVTYILADEKCGASAYMVRLPPTAFSGGRSGSPDYRPDCVGAFPGSISSLADQGRWPNCTGGVSLSECTYRMRATVDETDMETRILYSLWRAAGISPRWTTLKCFRACGCAAGQPLGSVLRRGLDW